MPLKILYEDKELLVIDKPASFVVLRESRDNENNPSIAEMLVGQFPELEKLGEERRYGIVHRLDKDTSGVLLVAKTKEMFDYLQEQFQERKVEKKYQCLVVGTMKENQGIIHSLLGRSPNDRRKQKSYLLEETAEGRREAITDWHVLKRYDQGYALLEVTPKTGRKHQVRAHLASVNHPIAEDKLYGFKNQPAPPGLERQFLHATYLKISLPDGIVREFQSELPEDLQSVLDALQAAEI